MTPSPPKPNDFEQAAAGETSPSLLGEFWLFLRESKKWWLLPILVILLVMSGLILLTGTAAAPFIYTLF